MTTHRTPGRPSRRPSRRLAGLVAAALGAAAVGVLAVAGPAPAPVGAAPGTGTGTSGQTLTVSNVDDLDPNGATVTVTGAGFTSANGFNVSTMGLYLSVCVDKGAAVLTTPCLGGVDQSGESTTTRWITNNPVGDADAVPISASGTFSTTLRVVSWDENTDCLSLPVGQECKIVTRVDHRGSGNRSQDVRVPIDFASGRRLLVLPATGVNPAGQNLTVKGDGYPTSSPGVYVVYGPPPVNHTDSTPYQRSAFVESAAMSVGGAFTVTLPNVQAVYRGENEIDYDFRAGGAQVSTFRAHGQPDPSGAYTAALPITFAGRSAVQSFVTAALTDFLRTTPTQNQVNTGVTQVQQQGKARYLTTLSTSDAWLAAVVDKLYVDTLGRPSDASGRTYWIGQLRSGRRTVAAAAAEFYASPEYFNGIGGGTVGSWIDDLYEKVLLRSSDAAGRSYWIGQVSRTSRGSVAYRIYQSDESARTRVRGLYQTLLGRSAESAGLTYWAPRVLARGDLTLAVFLADSPEYQNRAVTRFP